MIPQKLRHGDNLASLFERFNAVIDYLREIRLVAGSGIRLNKLASGLTIESTATASASGIVSSAGAATIQHPFDVELVNTGTEADPVWSVKIFDSTAPNSQYAGYVYIGDSQYRMPRAVLAVNTSDDFTVDFLATYDSENTRFSFEFVIRVSEYPAEDEIPTFRQSIAQGKLPEISSRQMTDIRISDRWV